MEKEENAGYQEKEENAGYQIFGSNDKSSDQSKFKGFSDNNHNGFGSSIKISLLSGRKHCGYMIKCWLLAFLPFPTMFSKAFFPRVVESRIVCGNGLIKGLKVTKKGFLEQ